MQTETLNSSFSPLSRFAERGLSSHGCCSSSVIVSSPEGPPRAAAFAPPLSRKCASAILQLFDPAFYLRRQAAHSASVGLTGGTLACSRSRKFSVYAVGCQLEGLACPASSATVSLRRLPWFAAFVPTEVVGTSPSAEDRLPKSLHFAESDVIMGVVRAGSVHAGGYGHKWDWEA